MKKIPTVRKEAIFLIFMLLSLVLAFSKIVIHLEFTILPILFLTLGAVSYLVNPKKSLYLFFFLLPLVSALADFFFIGYPYNYMGIILFYLAGLILGSLFRGEGVKFNQPWASPYLLFLVLLWISVLFLFLRWSNFTLTSLSFAQDTPVTSAGERVSFASIFPVVSLFLFSVSPFLPVLITRHLSDHKNIFKAMLAGYTLSLGVGYFQKFVDPDFMAIAWWGEKLNQYNGGFSDFNAFGFFSGALFLYFVIALVNKRPGNKSFQYIIPGVLLSLAGVFLSGCRTAFLFVIVALIFLIVTKKIKRTYKFAALALFLVLLIAVGGTLKQRMLAMADNIQQVKNTDNLWDALDKVTNGRVAMMQRSVPLLKKYPLTGVGGGNFLFFLKHQFLGETYWEDLPLNQYLLILDETGLIGFVVFMLFIVAVVRQKRDPILTWLLVAMLVAIFFNFFFWFPEIFLFFWIVIAFAESRAIEPQRPSRRRKIAIFATILLYLAANVIFFNALHPKTWSEEKEKTYDYGFWYPEKTHSGETYNWTKSQSGIMVRLDREGKSGMYKTLCGAPLDKIPGERQIVDIYWQGKLFKHWVFTENGELEFQLQGQPEEEGFLEFRVSPVFNLKKLNISPESRDLGVQVYPPGTK